MGKFVCRNCGGRLDVKRTTARRDFITRERQCRDCDALPVKTFELLESSLLDLANIRDEEPANLELAPKIPPDNPL